MLLELAQWLAKDIRVFNVFNYITLRTVLAALTSLAISFIVGPAMIRKLTAYKIGQSVREDGPQTHLVKAGTPTMGGALILVSIAITTLLWADLSNRYIWVVLMTTLGFGVIGWADDYRKVVHRNPKGLSARAKLFWQSTIAISVALYLALTAELPAQTTMIVPFFKQVAIPLGVTGFVALAYLVIVGTSNAVNLTDGLDGLAIMPTVMISSALAIFAYVAGQGVGYIVQAGNAKLTGSHQMRFPLNQPDVFTLTQQTEIITVTWQIHTESHPLSPAQCHGAYSGIVTIQNLYTAATRVTQKYPCFGSRVIPHSRIAVKMVFR